MNNSISFYIGIAKRWIWVVLLGMLICSGAAYVISKRIPPVYQSSVMIVINLGTSSSAYDNVNASLQAVPTYAQLLTSSQVLDPVIAEHHGLTLKQLSSVITVNPLPNTELIELEVQSSDPQLATQLVNQISQSFAQFVNTQLPASIQILPTQTPTDPISPKPLNDAAIGALVGLGLALALIVIFEWIDDRLSNPEEVQKLLGMEILTAIPYHSLKRRAKRDREIALLEEECRMLFAKLQAAQASKPFKLAMITSALPGEGKTTVAVHLAREMARAGKRVLLVDVNLRRPALDKLFQLNGHQSVANAFLQIWEQKEVNLGGQQTDTPGLYVLRAGDIPFNLSYSLPLAWARQLLEYFEKAPFDYVILDGPPLLPVADAQLLTSLVQTIVLVIDASRTPRKILLQAKQVLGKTSPSVLGAVINKNLWPDYDHIRRYLHYTLRPSSGTPTTMPPQTPIPDDMLDTAKTLTLPKHGGTEKDNHDQVV